MIEHQTPRVLPRAIWFRRPVKPRRSPTLQLMLLITLLTGWHALAMAASDERSEKHFDGFVVHYSAFNSSLINPEIAAKLGLTRSKNRALLNIAVVPTDQSAPTGGKPALVTGSVTNLLGQRQTLEFVEISEGRATYYLAPFRFDHEEVLTFDIAVRHHPDAAPQGFRFRQTFYRDL